MSHKDRLIRRKNFQIDNFAYVESSKVLADG